MNMKLKACAMIPGALFCSISLAAPGTVPDNVILPQCSEALAHVVTNDVDLPELQPLVLASVSEGSLGTASIEGPVTIRYVSRDQKGTDTLTYNVRNAAGEASAGVLTVVVSDESRCS